MVGKMTSNTDQDVDLALQTINRRRRVGNFPVLRIWQEARNYGFDGARRNFGGGERESLGNIADQDTITIAGGEGIGRECQVRSGCEPDPSNF
jgi:hypothetical protein